jgi:hypothetical protein
MQSQKEGGPEGPILEITLVRYYTFGDFKLI